MGVHDSSRTRVAPVFDRLFARDPTGRTWLPDLLGLVNPDTQHAFGKLEEAKWWPLEKALSPPTGLLRYLVNNLAMPSDDKAWGRDGATAERRRRLVARDPVTISEALTLLGSKQRVGERWHILEGTSYPDVYLRTVEAVVVIEGKRTEKRPTRSTRWMHDRHQMLRHLDCVYEVLGGRRLLGLMIVEGVQDEHPPPSWQDYLTELRSDTTLEKALPHRSDTERKFIRESILGVTTWQALCYRLQVPREVLIPRVEEVDTNVLQVRTRK